MLKNQADITVDSILAPNVLRLSWIILAQSFYTSEVFSTQQDWKKKQLDLESSEKEIIGNHYLGKGN